jgi:hypothetical protein
MSEEIAATATTPVPPQKKCFYYSADCFSIILTEQSCSKTMIYTRMKLGAIFTAEQKKFPARAGRYVGQFD